jgi:hypothetical protein
MSMNDRALTALRDARGHAFPEVLPSVPCVLVA